MSFLGLRHIYPEPQKRQILSRHFKHGDSVEIDKLIDFKITSLKGNTRIIHDHGITTINELSVEELTSIVRTI